MMPNALIGRYSRLRKTTMGRNVVLPESSVIGYNLEEDRAKGDTVTEGGAVMAPTGPEQVLAG